MKKAERKLMESQTTYQINCINSNYSSEVTESALEHFGVKNIGELSDVDLEKLLDHFITIVNERD